MARRLASALFLARLLCLSSLFFALAGTAEAETGAASLAHAGAGDAAVPIGDQAPQIVILCSYHPGDAWSDGELQGLLKGLAGAYPELVPAVEYLDAKRFPGPEHLAFLKDSLAHKYRGRRIDLAIALDNPALDLLRTYPDAMFPGVPTVFAGVNGYRPEMRKDRPETTGVAEVQDIVGTLELGLRLHPKTRRVLLVHDDTASGLALRQDTQALLPRFRDRVALDFAPDQPFAALERQLAALPPDSLVLILTYATDSTGQVLSREESTRLMAAASAAPLYAMHETRLGHGIVGGILLDGPEHGAQAAALALRVLRGEDPAQIPVETSHSYPELDDRQLRRFGVDPQALPADSRILYRPTSFYGEHRRLAQGVLALLLALAGAVAILATAVLRARRAEEAMRGSESRYRTLFETMAQGVVYQDREGRIGSTNPAALNILGLDPAQIRGRTSLDPRWRAIREDGTDFPGEDHPAMVALRTGRPVSGVQMGVFHPARGTYRWLIVHAHPQFRPGESSPCQVCTTFEDITERKESEQRIGRLSRLYRTLSDTSQAMVRIGDEATLLARICDIVCSEAGFGLVWIGLLDRARGLLIPAAAAGPDRASVLGREIPLDAAGAGLAALAAESLRTEESLLRDLEEPARATARPGLACAACLPLYRGELPAGVLAAASPEGGYFDPEVMALLQELARDISYALDNLDRARALDETLARLRESEQSYRIVAEYTSDWEYWLAPDGRVRYCSPSCERVSGYPREAFVDDSGLLAAIVHPQDIGAFERHRDTAMREDHEAALDLDFRILHRDGSVRWIFHTCQPVRTPEGEYLGVRASNRDITARRAAEQALAETQAQYRRMVETASEGIASMDAEHRATFVNRRMAQMVGYEPEEMLGRTMESFMFPEDLPDHRERMAGRHRGESAQYERRFRHRDGSAVWTIVSGVPLTSETGAFAGSFGMFTDITERRQAEERIRTQRALYEDILERVQEGIWVAGADERIVYANASMARIAGVPVESILGRRVLEDFPEETLREFRPLYRQAHESGRPLPYEIRVVTPAGQEAWQAGWLIPSLERGGLDGIICTVRDITRERATQSALAQYQAGLEETVAERTAELRAAEEHLRLILESTADGLYGLTPDGRVSFVNPAASRLLGFPAERLVGRSPHDLIHHSWPDGSPKPPEVCPTVATLREGQALTADGDVFWRADGQPLPVIYSTHPMIRDGKIVGAVVSFVDITERKRLEERLRRLAGAVEGIAGVRDLAELAAIVCEAARQLSGAQGATLVLREGGNSHYLAEDAIAPLWKGQRFPLERCACGWTILHARPLVAADIAEDPRVPLEPYAGTFVRALAAVPIGRTEPVGAICCYWAGPHRTTEQEQGLQQALADAAAVGLANLDLYRRLTEARAVAERLAQVKSVFLANMSHEIRTPMSAVVGLAHLLLRGTGDRDQRTKLGKILSAANHLLAIINDILDFSKIEAGKLELERRDFDLESVLARAFSLVADQARAKDLELILRLDPRLAASPSLRGDCTRLTQILLNFLANAVKFTERGSIVLEAAVAQDDAEGRLLRFAVRDTGIGIEQADQERLFDAFEQADTSTTRRHGGTGLGLAISRRLAYLMGGTVGLESIPGAGSTFWFTARMERGQDQPPRPGAERLHGRRALAADDRLEAREALVDLLGQLGLRARPAGSGTEALEAAQAAELAGDPFAFVLLDRCMPHPDGLATARLLQRLPLESPPAVILVAPDGHEGALKEPAGEAGVRAILAKPLTPSVLQEALLRALDGGAPPGSEAPTEPQAEVGPAELALHEGYWGARVLLAEDNPVNQEVALEMLRGAGLQTDLAADGAEAVARARAVPYDLILMDMQMPVLDGLEATRLIRQLPGYASTPILALTANAFGEDRTLCLEAGMDDHLGKPVEPEALFSALLKWLAPTTLRRSAPPAPPPRPRAPADPTADARLKPLLAIPGLDLRVALRSIAGRPDSLIRLLRVFGDSHWQDLPRLRERLAAGDRAEAARMAHSLKGVAVTLGAAELKACALDVETGVREGWPETELATLVDRLDERLSGLLRAVREALPPTEGGEGY